MQKESRDIQEILEFIQEIAEKLKLESERKFNRYNIREDMLCGDILDEHSSYVPANCKIIKIDGLKLPKLSKI